jgi:hypothetical protein
LCSYNLLIGKIGCCYLLSGDGAIAILALEKSEKSQRDEVALCFGDTLPSSSSSSQESKQHKDSHRVLFCANDSDGRVDVFEITNYEEAVVVAHSKSSKLNDKKLKLGFRRCARLRGHLHPVKHIAANSTTW